jgi:tetratricopeptide (TPR) repeat protein
MPANMPPSGTSTLKRITVWREDWRWLAGGAVLAAAAIAAYGGSFSVPPLYDDIETILNNLTIRHWGAAFFPPIETTAGGRPVLNLSLAVNHAVSGTAVWSYHAVNLAIHVLAGLTLFGIVRRTLARRAVEEASLIGFSAALLWTLHPLQTESVTYIVQRAESLMGLFYLLTLYCFIRGAGGEPGGLNSRSLLAGDQRHETSGIACKQAPTTGNRTSSRQWRWFALSVAACLLGMGTKEVMVSAPLIVLLYDRTFVAGSFREAWRQRWRVHAALAATWLPLVGLVAGGGWNRHGAAGFDVGITPAAYWLTQFEAVTRYLWLSVWPHPLVFEYGTFWVNRPAEVALYTLVVAGLAVAVLLALWRRPALGFLGAWLLVILAPTSVMPGRVQMIVEHRMYLALAAVMTLVAIGIHAAVGRRSWVVFAALALGFGMLTARRNEDYRSERSIWADTVAKRPNNERAHNNLGLAWSKVPGGLKDAIEHFRAALRLKPDYADAHNNLGVAWAKMPGRLNDAIGEIEAALRLQPNSVEAHTDLGVAWAKMPGRLNDAIGEFEAALRLEPNSVEARTNLGIALSNTPGRLNDAIAEFGWALRLDPDHPQAHNSLGLALARIPERLDDAIAEYATALRLKPDYAEAHNNLGIALAKTPGPLHGAIAEFEKALRLDPDYAEAHNNLGIALETVPGRLNDAIVQYEAAVRLKPDYAEAHNNLGLAFARIPGRLNDAIAKFEEAVRLKPDYAPGWHNLGASWFNRGNLPAAAAAFREELRLSPNNPAAQRALAAVLQQAENN